MGLILFVCNVSPTTAQTTSGECISVCYDLYNRCRGYAERNRGWSEWSCYTEFHICDWLGWGYGEDCDLLYEDCLSRARGNYESEMFGCAINLNECLIFCD